MSAKRALGGLIRVGFTLRIVFVFLVLAIGLAAVLYLTSAERIQRTVDESAEEVLFDAASVLSQFASAYFEQPQALDQFMASLNEPIGNPIVGRIYGQTKALTRLRGYVTDSDGIVLAATNPKWKGQDYSQWRDVWLTLQGQYGARTTSDGTGETVMYVAMPIYDQQQQIVGVFSIGKPKERLQRYAANAQRALLLSWLGFVSLAGILAALASRFLAGGLVKLRQWVTALKDDPKAEKPKISEYMMRELADDIDAMHQEIQEHSQLEQTLQSITHEMKSPLAAIQAHAELLGDDLPKAQQIKSASRIQSAGQRLTQMVEQLLRLTVLDRTDRLSVESEIDLCDLLQSIIAHHQPKAGLKNIRIELQAVPVTVSGHGNLLENAFGSLLQNALDFAPENSVVLVSVADHPLKVDIIDQGPGVPAYAEAKIFDRFFSLPRADGEKSTGLGLAIAHKIAQLHGARVTLSHHQGLTTASFRWDTEPHNTSH